MRLAIARAVMTVAVRCFGERRRGWASAMRAEFEIAAAQGEALGFAFGCFVAAWRAMPGHEEGRFTLASHVLAIGLIVPVGVLQISSVLLALPYPDLGIAGIDSAGHVAQVSAANRSALPALAFLTLALGIGQMYLAWVTLKRDWARVVAMTMFGAAGMVTLLVFTSVAFLGEGRAVVQAALMTTELAAVCLLARWSAELPPGEAPGSLL